MLKIGFFLTVWEGGAEDYMHMSHPWLYKNLLKGWSFLMVTRNIAIDTLIPCTIQKFLFILRMLYYAQQFPLNIWLS